MSGGSLDPCTLSIAPPSIGGAGAEGYTPPPTGLRRAARPPIVWSLSLLLAFKALIALAVLAYPLGVHQPTGVIATGGAIAFAGAWLVWIFGPRFSMLGFELIAAAGVLAASFLVAEAQTTGGMMLAAFAYPWIAIYAAHFFPRRVVNALGAFITLAFAAGLAVDSEPRAAIYWVIVTSTVWSICIVLGGLSEGLRRHVVTDQLTGALNRSGLAAAATRERAIADRTQSPLVVVAIDLDGFKQINDRAGHAAGDRVLASLVGEWRGRLRPEDILARHGGDEFVLLLPSSTETAAHATLARLRSAGQQVGWSAGIAEWASEESLDDALARADGRLYEEKLAKQAHPPAGAALAQHRPAVAGSF